MLKIRPFHMKGFRQKTSDFLPWEYESLDTIFIFLCNIELAAKRPAGAKKIPPSYRENASPKLEKRLPVYKKSRVKGERPNLYCQL